MIGRVRKGPGDLVDQAGSLLWDRSMSWSSQRIPGAKVQLLTGGRTVRVSLSDSGNLIQLQEGDKL